MCSDHTQLSTEPPQSYNTALLSAGICPATAKLLKSQKQFVRAYTTHSSNKELLVFLPVHDQTQAKQWLPNIQPQDQLVANPIGAINAYHKQHAVITQCHTLIRSLAPQAGRARCQHKSD